jgi:hypothetical protein
MHNKTSFFILAVTLFVLSCNTAGRLRKECVKGRDLSAPAVLVTNDGVVHGGQKLSYDTKTKIFDLDGKQYPLEEVMVNQYPGNLYFLRQNGKAYTRVRGGRLNLYYATHNYSKVYQQSGTRMQEVAYDFYLQKQNGTMYDFSVKELRSMISDNAAALAQMEKIYPNTKKEYYNTSYLKMIKVVEFYNAQF